MKAFLEGIVVAFSMYSKIPMPKVEWKKSNLKHIFKFFPVIGLIVGLAVFGWLKLAGRLNLNVVLVGVFALVIPIFISGGIHLDGFIDSCDAIASYGDKEKRLEILTDPNAGAFGVIYTICYLLILLGGYCQLYAVQALPYSLILIFVASRAVGGLIAIVGKSAKKTGLKHTLTKNYDGKSTIVVLIIWLMVVFGFITVENWVSGLLSLVLIAIFMVVFKKYTDNSFGGFTGDLIGFAICFIDLIILFCILIGEMLQ